MLAQGSREVTVELIAHLAELDRRKLHRGEGPGKLFGFSIGLLTGPGTSNPQGPVMLVETTTELEARV
jgi:hypothetical protein